MVLSIFLTDFLYLAHVCLNKLRILSCVFFAWDLAQARLACALTLRPSVRPGRAEGIADFARFFSRSGTEKLQ
jgi:hypothetical protein